MNGLLSHIHYNRGKYGIIATLVATMAFVSQVASTGKELGSLWRWHQRYVAALPCGPAAAGEKK